MLHVELVFVPRHQQSGIKATCCLESQERQRGTIIKKTTYSLILNGM